MSSVHETFITTVIFKRTTTAAQKKENDYQLHTIFLIYYSLVLTKRRVPTLGRDNFANPILLSNRSNLFNIVQWTSFKVLNGGEECGSKRNDQISFSTLKLCHLFGIFNGLLEKFFFFARHGSCRVCLNGFYPSTS